MTRLLHAVPFLAVAWLWSAPLLAQQPAAPGADAPEQGAESTGEQPSDNKRHADELFQQAHAALDAGDWDTACDKFRESMRYDISVSTQLNIARCREHEGDLVEAWNDYNRARILNRDIDDEARRKALGEYLEKSVAELEKRLPKVRVVIRRPPAHLTISRDGTAVAQSAAGEPFPVNPGEHEIAIAAPGHRTEKRTVQLVEGQTLELVIEMVVGEDERVPPVTPLPAPPLPEPDVAPASPKQHGTPAWVWPVGAVGVVALGAGIGVAVLSVSARSKLEDGCSKQAGTFECPDDQFSQQDIDGLVRDSNGGLAGALVLGAAGIACITASAAVIAGSSSSDGDAASAAWRMLPLLAPEDGGRVTAGAVVEARF